MKPVKNNNFNYKPMINEKPAHITEGNKVKSSWWRNSLRKLADVKIYIKTRIYRTNKEKKISEFIIKPTPVTDSHLTERNIPTNRQSTISKKALNEVKIRNLLIAADIILDASVMTQKSNNMLDKLNAELYDILTESKQPEAETPVTDKKIIAAVKKQPENLRKRLIKAGIPKQNLKNLIKEKTIESLNYKEWKQVSRTIETKGLGTLKSTQIPAAQMRTNPDSNTDMFPTSYNGSGVSSATSTSSDHAVNLWTSSLTNDETNKILYQGVRHGVNSAYGLEGKSRDDANIIRAKETILAALKLKPDLLQEALTNPEKPVHIDCTSMSLLTPDWIRKGDEGEKKMLLEQLKAFNSLSSKEQIELEIVDNGVTKTINVSATILCFNFGVNQGAVNPMLSKVVGGWGVSDPINKKGLDALIGDPDQKTTIPGGLVMKYLNESADLIKNMESSKEGANQKDSEKTDKDISEIRKKCAAIMQLEQQIRTIYRGKLHHHDNNEAYKMPARIQLLAHLLGVIPMSNCKSGKDRTGALDYEAKFLAIKYEITGRVPEPSAPLSDEDRELLQTIILNSGNLEIQEYNTGLQGYKTQGVKSITKRIGNSDVLREAKGGSAAVGS